MCWLGLLLELLMAEDINNLLARLKFSEEESTSVVGLRKHSMDDQGYEAWAIGKVLSKDKINREAMYRLLKLIWFTKEPVKLDQSNSNVGNWRNGVQFLIGARISSNINAMEEVENEEGDTIIQWGKGKGKMGEEVSDSGYGKG
ncbi:hypothetical protein PVK06_035186 [Gossypium arboreum]|uniref:Uncharacterized protein n=1 Tax=Gossypium arboreum TaxID=29729 RepID=A0ABR0NH44_GOSAR|nr:hypothetical protein PVK06_035186 [Gossypium arboreum]